jgi:hypothetical protein
VQVGSDLSGGLGRSWFSPINTCAVAGFAIDYNFKTAVAFLAWKIYRTITRALGTGR